MDVRHNDPDLERAELAPTYEGEIDAKIVRAIKRRLNYIRNTVQNETQLWGHKGLHFEKLKGKRSHQYSIKLNDQWRLILEFEERPGPNSNICVVINYEDYHKG